MQDNDILSVSKPPTLSTPSSSSASSSHLPRDSQPDSSGVKTSTHIQPRQLYGRPLDPGYRYRDPQAEQEAIRKQATFEARLLEDEAKIITLHFFYDITKGPFILKAKPHIELPTSSKFILRDEPMFMTALQNAQIPESAIAYYDLTITPPCWIILSDPGIPITVIHGQTLVLRDARKEAGAFDGLPHLLACLSIAMLNETRTNARPSKKICALDIRQPSGPSTFCGKPQHLSNKKINPKSIVDLSPSTVKSGFDKLIALLDNDTSATFKDAFPHVFPNMVENTMAYRYFSVYKTARADFKGVVNRLKFDESKSVQKVWADLKQEVEKAKIVQADSTPVCFELKDVQLDNPPSADLEIVEVKKGYLENSASSTGRYHSIHKLWKNDFTFANMVIKKLASMPLDWPLEHCPKDNAVILDAERFVRCSQLLHKFISLASEKNVHLHPMKCAKTYLASGIEDVSVSPRTYLWHDLAQKYVSGAHFTTIRSPASAYIPDTDIDMAQSLQAFEHFVFESSKGTLVVRNFQGYIQKDEDETLIIVDCDLHTSTYDQNRDEKYYITNEGLNGIDHFLHDHKCNYRCNLLGLSSL
ncbi:hypothetical protein CPC08DRAFT_505073 [Agrocybe pediades]|nr:hypothetical protein CPC08DRAFT_505073 [Agrocybe pediades]